MKREFIFIGEILIIFLLVSFVSAADVAYVLKYADKNDSVLMDVFEGMELSVDVIEDKNIPSTDFSEHQIIFVPDERLDNFNLIPKDSPVVVLNKDYAEDFGFLEKGRSRKIASSSQLKIKKNSNIVNVYESARYNIGGVSIPYSYLPARYENENIESVGLTFTRRANELGSVIAYLDGDNKKCFFGITETKFWTEDAKELFEDCVDYVLDAGFHDVKIDTTYTSSVNGVRIKDDATRDYLLEQVPKLICNKKYKIDFKTLNIGNFIENVEINGVFGNFTWDATKNSLAVGGSTTVGSKTINITSSGFPVGFYNVTITASISDDKTLSDNSVMRSVEVVC